MTVAKNGIIKDVYIFQKMLKKLSGTVIVVKYNS